jgi:hypothetical protein
MSMMGSGVVVAVAVDDVGVEAILIGKILDGPHVTTGLLQGVLAHDLVTVAGFLLSVRVSSLVVGHAVRVIVLGVRLRTKILCV